MHQKHVEKHPTSEAMNANLDGDVLAVGVLFIYNTLKGIVGILKMFASVESQDGIGGRDQWAPTQSGKGVA